MPFVMSTNPVVTISGSDPIVSVGGSTPIISIKNATVDQKGAVQLEDSTASTSIIKAATPKSVKDSYDHTTTVSGALKVYIDEKSAIGHDHDERYYTETELNAGQLDGRYYTGSELDAGQLDDRYYTETEIDDISDALQLNIDGKSDTDHLHDDRYYTESEVDNLITTVSGKLDDHNEMNNLDYDSSGHIGFASSDILSMASAVELTLVSGTVTRTQTLHRIDTEGDAAIDDLDTILGGVDGDIIIARAENGTRTVTLKDGTGNLKLGGRDLGLIDTNMAVMLFYSGVLGQWLLIGDGGGSVTAAVSDDAFSSAWDGGTAVAPSRNAVYDVVVTKSDLSHLHDDRYYTESEVDTISGTLQTNIDGKSDTGHLHDDRYYTESELNNGQLDDRYYTETEVDTISGSLQTNIDGKSDTSHIHDDRYYTETEVDSLITTISGKLDDHNELNNLDYASSGHTGFQPAGDYLTDTEFSTYSGTLQTQIDGKSDTDHLHDDRYYTESEVDDLIATVSGVTDHSELSNLDYASSGHTGFQPSGDYSTVSELTTLSGALKNDIDGKSDIGHLHDDVYYTETEVDTISGSLQTKIDGKADTAHTHDDRYYTESEVDTISGSLQNDIDTHGHVSTEITVSKINTPTYGTLQEWINNTQSAGRMSGGNTTAHTETITGVTEGGAGSGEFKVAGDHTACFIFGATTLVEGSTNNDGYYTVASGVVYSGGTTTVPVDEAVGAVADGITYNGTVDVADGTGFIKATDSDIGETVSFNIHAETSIVLTDTTTNYLYVDYNTGTPNIKVTTDKSIIEKNRQFPLSMTYRNGPRTWTCECGIYLPNKTRLDHDRILVLRGYERATGGEISEVGTRSIASTAGEFFRGTTEINTTSKNSTTDKLTTVYYDGADWVWTENLTQIDNTYYNDVATGLVELGVSKYAVHWICIDYLSNLYVVYGRGSYSLSEAELAGVPSLMPVVANEFGIIAAKVIIQKTAASFTELISAYTQLIPTATPAVHNNLSGLNDNDYKHLTATEKTKFDDIATGADVTGDNPPQAHTHDERYYTEGEVDTISGTLSSEIDSDISTHASNTDAHHAQSHNIASHSDTTATGGELNALTGGSETTLHKHKRYIQIRLLDKDTSHTVSNGIAGDFRFTQVMTVTGVACYFDTAGTTSATTLDINESGTTILSTKLTVDATEKTSETAATPAVISDSTIAANAIITFDLDGIASGTAGKGLIIELEVTTP